MIYTLDDDLHISSRKRIISSAKSFNVYVWLQVGSQNLEIHSLITMMQFIISISKLFFKNNMVTVHQLHYVCTHIAIHTHVSGYAHTHMYTYMHITNYNFWTTVY